MLREHAGIIDISNFAKYEVKGPGAEAWLNALFANRMPTEIGRSCLTPLIGKRGGIAGDFTVTKLADDEFMVFGSGMAERFHQSFFKAVPLPEGTTFRSRTEDAVRLQRRRPEVARTAAAADQCRSVDGSVSLHALAPDHRRRRRCGGAAGFVHRRPRLGALLRGRRPGRALWRAAQGRQRSRCRAGWLARADVAARRKGLWQLEPRILARILAAGGQVRPACQNGQGRVPQPRRLRRHRRQAGARRADHAVDRRQGCRRDRRRADLPARRHADRPGLLGRLWLFRRAVAGARLCQGRLGKARRQSERRHTRAAARRRAA